MKYLLPNFNLENCLLCGTNNFQELKNDGALIEEVCIDCNKFYYCFIHAFNFELCCYIYDYIKVELAQKHLDTIIFYTKDKSPIYSDSEVFDPKNGRELLSNFEMIRIENELIIFESLSEVEKYIENQVFK